MDCIFSASQIIEKHREFNIPTYIAFIDFKKAFDSVDRDKLWTIMSSKRIPTHLITTIQTIYIWKTLQELMQVMEYLKILESLPKGLNKVAHFHLFYLIYIWMKLSGFG